MERHSFPIVSVEPHETMQKLCLSTKLLNQEARWNYGIFCSANWNSFFLAIQRLQEHPSFCSACVGWYVLFYKNLIVFQYWENSHSKYCHLDGSQRTIPTQKIPTQDKSHLDKTHQQNSYQGNSHSEQLPLRKFPPRFFQSRKFSLI